MKVAPDTNVLVRILTQDDPRQSAIAQKELTTADLACLSTSMICEVAWVLSRGYRLDGRSIAGGIRRLTDADNVVADRRAIEASLVQLEAGGDFADGAIAKEGGELGADTFISFDRKAVRLLKTHGFSAKQL